ncbi:hypothetical protein OBBRIDRAFT_813579 [Obba rivulosa]|uniref:Uncharacterized protein n=1 Tax=Obba rivulosa TaxID=1052685 RepID=A0A8E2AUF9_9APHY|nr:hypothetical protein OBBRIDRAFT_813579 [Obba rivulosa]
MVALSDIEELLYPHRKNGKGRKDPNLGRVLRERLEAMRSLLYNFTDSQITTHGIYGRKGPWYARKIRKWTKEYIKDRTTLPHHHYGTWSSSKLDDEDFAEEIHLHLQGIGQYVRALDLVYYLDRPEVKAKYGMTKTISLATAQRWMKKLGYRWTMTPKGQYADGHECEDVVAYRQNVFLLRWKRVEDKLRNWTKEGLEDIERWVHKSEHAKPYQKGEGASLMVADFVSADYGWLRAPDHSAEARVYFKAGKNRDGYFTHEEILAQAENAITILKQHFSEDDHILIFDNARTHVKRADDALSARKMPKFISKEGSNWGVKVTTQDSNGKILYGSNGKPLKEQGMAVILQERGFHGIAKKNAECKGFKCPPGATDCCCRRFLFNQPDFMDVDSLLETTCQAYGIPVIFLPKFHCEINFIEQCWGYAKQTYRLNPPSSKEEDLERNIRAALETIPLGTMRRYATRSRRFIDAYDEGLNGQQAAWAGKKYSSHRVLPTTLLQDLGNAKID